MDDIGGEDGAEIGTGMVELEEVLLGGFGAHDFAQVLELVCEDGVDLGWRLQNALFHEGGGLGFLLVGASLSYDCHWHRKTACRGS